MNGRIILLNGTSSSGKTTLARALRPELDQSFCYYASDQLADARFRPLDPDVRFDLRDAFFRGFHRSIPAFASAGLDLLVEHIVETQEWALELQDLLRGFDCFWVGVHAPLDELAAREKARGDRTLGEAEYHFKTHDFCRYDVEVTSKDTALHNAVYIAESWKRRKR